MILYTAAHGGFSRDAVPLGGGAAVFEHLAEEWSRTRPFEFRAITPAILASHPSGRDVVNFSENDYARFSREFERAATKEIFKYDPASTVVLANDISEGPDFRALAERGYRVFTIFHVDVVAYVASIYLRGVVAPETTVRWERRLRRILPSITRLIWEKQEACVRFSHGLIVPSEGMREVLLRCYPECPRERIHVLPWGAWSVPEEAHADVAPVESDVSAESLRAEFEVPREAQVLLTLSRISPEKGQDLLLEALRGVERSDRPLWLFICGDAAFMQGRRFMEKLRRLAERVRDVRVIFPGYVTGARKRAFFAMADVYVFPSRHESYGLTLVEALAAGLPAVCLDSPGAREAIRGDYGLIVRPDELAAAITRLLRDENLCKQMGERAHEFARKHPFAAQAAKLTGLLIEG